jgi:hypothetical protein
MPNQTTFRSGTTLGHGHDEQPIDQLLSELSAAVLMGQRTDVVGLVKSLLERGILAQMVEAMVHFMDDIGPLSMQGNLFRCSQPPGHERSIGLLQPDLLAAGVEPGIVQSLALWQAMYTILARTWSR